MRPSCFLAHPSLSLSRFLFLIFFLSLSLSLYLSRNLLFSLLFYRSLSHSSLSLSLDLPISLVFRLLSFLSISLIPISFLSSESILRLSISLTFYLFLSRSSYLPLNRLSRNRIAPLPIVILSPSFFSFFRSYRSLPPGIFLIFLSRGLTFSSSLCLPLSVALSSAILLPQIFSIPLSFS